MPCEHFMEKCALSHLARDRLYSACVTEIWSRHRFRISRQVWTDLQTLWLADFPITALAYWREMGCKCCPSAKCQCVVSSDHIPVNKLCNPHWNATSDFCSTKKNTPLLSFKLKYSVFQFENILMGFETAERDCVTSISKVILFAPETPPSLAGSNDPSPLAASWRRTCVWPGRWGKCAICILGVGASPPPKKIAFFF